MIKAKYVHTNLIARNWQSLAGFYQDVFGCIPIPPKRDFSGNKIEAGTGIKDIHLQGIHLKLPGYDDCGPTLEIFTYTPLTENKDTALNTPGYGHIAFQVEDVSAAAEIVLQAGGRAIGEEVTLELSTGAKVTWRYVTDPEGNIIELQKWG